MILIAVVKYDEAEMEYTKIKKIAVRKIGKILEDKTSIVQDYNYFATLYREYNYNAKNSSFYCIENAIWIVDPDIAEKLESAKKLMENAWNTLLTEYGAVDDETMIHVQELVSDAQSKYETDLARLVVQTKNRKEGQAKRRRKNDD